MKRGTPEHPKMLDLAEAIYAHLESQGVALPPAACETLACGTLERLHHHAARYAPAGDVGKHSNARIAKAIGWDSDAEWIIDELCRLKWIDDNIADCRLYIHDWHVHSDDYADRYLADNGLRYANGSKPRNKPRKNSPAANGITHAPDTHNARGTHADGTRHASPSEPESNPESDSEPNPPPTPKPAARADGGGEDISWRTVTAGLRKAGLSDADGAVAGAKANGCKPIDVVCISLYWQTRPKCWSEGALHARIKNARPDENPEDHWPPPSPEWDKTKKREADHKAKAELARLTVLKQKQAEQERARLADLECRYGPALDSLADDDLDQLAAPIIGTNEMKINLFRKSRAKSPLLREQLLTAVAERNGSA